MAAKAVVKLKTNTSQKKAKDGQYTYGFFKMYKATKVYLDLAHIAQAVDTINKGASNTKILAVPSIMTLCLQVMLDLVLTAKDKVNGGSKYVPNVKSSE